jgi:diguanylate cyclase (GGDEF)-like protein/PAS domain S-box-containing protein
MPSRITTVFTNSKVVIAAGSALMITLMVALTIIGLSHMASINRNMETITQQHNARVDLLVSMRRIVRERSLSMYSIYLTKDVFARDDEYIRFHGLAESFIKLRGELENMGLLPLQKPVYEHGLSLIRRSAPLQSRIVDRMINGELTDVYELMSAIDLPLEKSILTTFDQLVNLEREASDEAVNSAKEKYQEAYWFMLGLGVLLALTATLIAFLVVRRTSVIEQALAQAKEHAEVTLHALGEAVLTADASGNVVYLNPAAERLTGWPSSEAHGKPLHEIYALQEESTSRPLSHPAFSGQIHGPVAGLQQHATLTNRNQDQFIVNDLASPLCTKKGEVFGTVVISRDVTQERQMSQQLSWQASHDSLTGLLNRNEFEATLRLLIQDAKVSGKHHALMYMDLDQFKIVNDTCGHFAGDELLKQLAQLLLPKIRESDTLARLGGDEFGLILEGCQLKQASDIAQQLLDLVKDFRFVWSDKTFSIGMSIGLVAITNLNKDLVSTLSAADAACFIAKDKGRHRVWIHHTDDDDVVQHKGEMEWVSRLNEALDKDRFELFVQHVKPIKHPLDGCYHEILLRLKQADGSLVSPMAFIPAAERYGLMTAIDRWVIRQAFQWLSQHKTAYKRSDIFAINISGQSLADPQFLPFCVNEYKRRSIVPDQVCLEITETAAIANWSHANQLFAALKDMGFKFALDDFGSGMSSFGYLKYLPLDYIKIDGSFVKDMVLDQVDKTFVEVINQIGHVMALKTIAEFVEDEQTVELLQKIGVDFAQGFSIHKPAALETAFAARKLA